MRRRLRRSLIVAASIILSLISPISAYAKSLDGLQTYTDDEEILVFLPDVKDEIVSVKAQIGNLSNAEIEVEPVSDNYKVYTTILFDNSLSIAEENRENMKKIAEEIIQNHQTGEVFSIYTIDTDLRELAVESESYDELLTAVDNIQYVNQSTYLKNVLYEAFNNVESKADTYQRFIVFSDGTDDNAVGYTYNDITRLLDEEHYTVCAIGSKYDKKLDDLEDMFSIARAASSSYFLVDKNSNVSEIVEEVNESIPQYAARIKIPDVAKNGSTQNIKIVINTSDNEYSFTTSAEMPFQEIVDTEEAESAIDTTEETESQNNEVAEVEANSNTIQQEDSNKMPMGVIIPVIAIIIALCVIAFNRMQRKKIEEKRLAEIQNQKDDEEDDATVLMKSDEDDDDTILMKDEEDDDATCMVKTVVLLAENGTTRYEFKCVAETTIGRKSICDIQIVGDKSVSGVHCIISCDGNGNPVIKDNNSSNGTYLNDEKLTVEKTLENGDTLEIGRTRYAVQILGE